jgi:hypothetical protein
MRARSPASNISELRICSARDGKFDSGQGRNPPVACDVSNKGDTAMPMGEMLYLVGVVAAMTIFAGTIFWVERHTRSLP